MRGVRRRERPRLARVGLSGLLGLWSLVAVGPLVWLGYTSLKTAAGYSSSPWLPPTDPHFGNWWTVLTSPDLLAEPLRVYVVNSVVVSVPASVAAVMTGASAAYGFVRFRVRGASVFWLFLFLLLPVPVFAVMVPVYSYMQALGLTNQLIGLILVYFAFNLAFAIMLMRGFLSNLPKGVVEAALIDGCSEVQAFARIVLPLAKGALIACGLLVWLGVWGEFPLASVLVSHPGVMTIQPALASLASSGAIAGSASIIPALSALFLTTAVPVAVYLVSQRSIFRAVSGGWGEL